MPRTWTKVGEEYSKDKQEQIAEAIKGLQWRTLPCEMGMMPGEGIKTAIRQLKIPHVSKVASSPELAPYGLLAIEGHYKNGMARVYLVDAGTEVTPVATDFFPAVIKTLDGDTPVEWWDRDHFVGRATHIITGHSDADVKHEVIPIDDACIICDFCNDDIEEFPCPVLWGTHALCEKCFQKVQENPV